MSLTCDFVRGAAFAGADHDEKLHDGVVDPRTAGLHHENILLTNASQDPDTRLALLFPEASQPNISVDRNKRQ